MSGPVTKSDWERLAWGPPASDLPGVKTLVTDKSKKNLPNGIDRTPEQVLPPGSATPNSAKPGGGGGGGGSGDSARGQSTRDIPEAYFNTPDGSSTTMKERQRTQTQPGEQRPAGETKYDYNMPTRRLVQTSEVEAGLEERFPKKRQRHQRGPAKTNSRRWYKGRKGRHKQQALKRYNRLKNRKNFQRDRELRREYPDRFKRRRASAEKEISFVYGPDHTVGWLDTVGADGMVWYTLDSGEQPKLPLLTFLNATAFIEEGDIEAFFGKVDEHVLHHDGITPEAVHAAADLWGIAWDNDTPFMDHAEELTGKRHLDDMTEEELELVADAITEGTFDPVEAKVASGGHTRTASVEKEAIGAYKPTKTRRKKWRGVKRNKGRQYERKRRQRGGRKNYQRVYNKRRNKNPRVKYQRKLRQRQKSKWRKVGDVLTAPQVHFLYGPDQDDLGILHAVSSFTGMVTFRTTKKDAEPLMSVPVTVLLESIIPMTEEDGDALFDILEAELGADFYDELEFTVDDLADCAKLYGKNIDSSHFKAKCMEMLKGNDIETAGSEELALVNSILVTKLEGHGFERTKDNEGQVDEGDAQEVDPSDDNIYFGEVDRPPEDGDASAKREVEAHLVRLVLARVRTAGDIILYDQSPPKSDSAGPSTNDDRKFQPTRHVRKKKHPDESRGYDDVPDSGDYAQRANPPSGRVTPGGEGQHTYYDGHRAAGSDWTDLADTKLAREFKVEIGQPIWYGKYKNKRGVIKEFKTNDKGDTIIVVEPIPNPTGRKQPKELKLFRVRPREVKPDGEGSTEKAGTEDELDFDLEPYLDAELHNVRAAVADKYKDIDFKPPSSVAKAAEKGLEYRREASPSNRGGLTTEEAGEQGIGSGVQRAVNLKNRDTVTPETIGKMVGFFARHEKNKSIAEKNKTTPWNDKGYVAWLLWGGDPGKTWAEKVKRQMDAADEKAKKTAATSGQENEPTNSELWAKVIRLTKGEIKSLSHGGKTIEGPNEGRGFDIYPCVPVGGSEALTRRGWVGYFDLRVGEEIVTYNRERDCLEWSAVTRLHHHQEAPLLRIYKAATCFDFLCTEHHRWVIRNKPRVGTGAYKPRALKHPDQLVRAEDITSNMDLITSAQMVSGEGRSLRGFRKREWSWVERVLSMSHEQREAWFASAIVYDGHENGYSEKYDRCSYGFSQKDPDHADATAICGVLLGYNVTFRSKKDNPEMTAYTFIDRRTHKTHNVIKEPAGTAEVWCPETSNGTWVMRQGRMITITGNSAYANGWAAKTYKGLGGGWKKKGSAPLTLDEVMDLPLREANGKSKKDVGKGGLDEWFSGHGGDDGDARWGDWVAISPVEKTLDSGKKVKPGDIVGPCGISDDPDWEDYTNGGEDPLKCMPRNKAHDMPKKERAELAKKKQRAEKKDKGTGKSPTNTPTFKKDKKADQDGSYMTVQHLRSMQEHAKEMVGRVDNTTSLPDWAESQITWASTSLTGVYEYMFHGRGREASGHGGAYMTVQRLREIYDHATDLLGRIDECDQLPDWAESKISQSAYWVLNVYECLGHSPRVKSAARLADLITRTSPEVLERASGLTATVARATPARGMWLFNVQGSSGNWRVRVKGIRKGGTKALSKLQVKVSCSCPFWRWQGPEHWGKTNGFLYGRPRGTATYPKIMDPPGNHWVCKHVLAALKLARNYRLASESGEGFGEWFGDDVELLPTEAPLEDLYAGCDGDWDAFANRQARKLQRLSPGLVTREIMSKLGEVASEYRPMLGIFKSGIKTRKMRNPGLVVVGYELHDKDRDTSVPWTEDFNARWLAVVNALVAAGYTLVANPLGDQEWDQGSARRIALQTGVVGVAKPLSEGELESRSALLESLRTDLTRLGVTGPNGHAASAFKARAWEVLSKTGMRKLKELAREAGVRSLPRYGGKEVLVATIADAIIRNHG